VDTTRPSLGSSVAGALILAGILMVPLARSVTTEGTAPEPEPVATWSTRTGHEASPGRKSGYAVWALDRAGRPLRWDACSPIQMLLSRADAPEHARRDLSEALAVLREATGLDLQLIGTTDERPRIDRPLVGIGDTGWRWLPVLVAWARPGEGGLPLTALDRGVALPVSVRDGEHEAYVTGQVVLNVAREDLVPGFADRRDAIGATLIHELAHLLGLAHVDDDAQLMSVGPGSGPVVLGAGDLDGLRAVGAEAGCNTAPRPEVGRGLVGPTRPVG